MKDQAKSGLNEHWIELSSILDDDIDRKFRTMITAALANIVLNLILIPSFGINGAAIATAVSIGGVNVANTIWVRRKMDIQPVFLFPHLR